MSLADEDLLGFWKLEALYQQNPDGSREWLLGEDAEGFIFYEAGGNMCAMLQAAERTLSGEGREVPDAEASRAWHTFFAYSGRWKREGDVVRHEVRFAHDPRIVGSTFERAVDLEGDRLTLSGEHPYNPGQVAYVVWSREGR